MRNLLTVTEVAPLLRLDPQGVYRFARAGQIPHVRIGARKVRFTEESLREWIEEQLAKNQKPQNQGESLPATA